MIFLLCGFVANCLDANSKILVRNIIEFKSFILWKHYYYSLPVVLELQEAR